MQANQGPQQQGSNAPRQPQQPQQQQPQPIAARPVPPSQPRFEDLTIDDDLPLLPRLQRYLRSAIALQRLVHVRMLGDAAIALGPQLTAVELVPLLPPLVRDAESIIRQRICVELRVMALVLIGMAGRKEPPDADDCGVDEKKDASEVMHRMPRLPLPNKASKYYKVMAHHLFPHLHVLVADADGEVRRAASETIVKLALRVHVDDVLDLILAVPLKMVRDGQKKAANPQLANNANSANNNAPPSANNNTPAEDILITASNLLADIASFLPPPRLTTQSCARYISPTLLSLADDANFRVRRSAVQALPRALSSAGVEEVKKRLLPKFVSLSGDEMYRVRKASGECLVDVSRALAMLGWRVHFADVWIDKAEANRNGTDFYKRRSKKQIGDLSNTLKECHEMRRRVLCGIAKNLLDDANKFVRYGMMQFLGPLIASFYPLDRGSMVGAMGGLLFGNGRGSESAVLGIGVESVGIAKGATGLERFLSAVERSDCGSTYGSVEEILSYNHSLHGLELILHGESPISRYVMTLGGGNNASQSPFGTMGPQFFPHANGMVGRSSALDDDDTDAVLLSANLKKNRDNINPTEHLTSDPRALLPKFILESRSDALALSRIVMHRNGCIPNVDASSAALPYPPLMLGRPDPEDLKAIRSTLLRPFIAMATCRTGEDTTDAEMRVYCAYSLPAVVLLFGSANWEKDDLKGCFLDLIGRSRPKGDDETDREADDEEGNNNDQEKPPLPVKRCLASSIHAVAHMLGPEVVSQDSEFLASFEHTFLRDSDEAIRFNILKNCASFLAALPPGDGEGHRNHYLPVIHSTIMGEDVLGAAKKRSASNPGVLNWRQRDTVAKVLPDLIVLFSPSLNREFIWPILKALLSDSVSAVRENAGWSVPVLIRKYASASSEKDANAWIAEVVTWLKETLLDTGSSSAVRTAFRRPKKQMVSSEGAFSKRQGYCRICAAVALAMRMGESEDEYDEIVTPDPLGGFPIDPFSNLSYDERELFRSILLNDLLPPALEMTVDCVANVRMTLTKSLKVMPQDILKQSRVEEVLNTLEEELMTWDVGDLPLNDVTLSMGTTSPTASGGGMMNIMGSADPPEGVMMTSTMSAC
ncbi:hypothetical protein ACHAW6_009868 [Cyclotella cf. meneghiniana]